MTFFKNDRQGYIYAALGKWDLGFFTLRGCDADSSNLVAAVTAHVAKTRMHEYVLADIAKLPQWHKSRRETVLVPSILVSTQKGYNSRGIH